METHDNYLDEFKRLIEIITALRTPVTGCPWDLEQTPKTMLKDLIEETYELVEAVNDNDIEHTKEEIGDLLLNTMMICYMNKQENNFLISDMLKTINDKLVRRHPHVFSDTKVKDSGEVLANWDKIKTNIEGRKSNSILDGIPKSFPPMEYAAKMQKKAAKVGFDWESHNDIFLKIEEEVLEIKEILNSNNRVENMSKQQMEKLQGECGDLLFCVVNLCRKLTIDPSVALQMTNKKFKERFSYIESKMADEGLELSKKEFKKRPQSPY